MFTKHSSISVSRFDWLRLSRRGAIACMLALSAVLLLAQGVELSHSHDDIQSQLDCQICLKHGSKGKLHVASGISLDLRSASVYGLDIQPEQPLLALPPAKSRAPPQQS